MLGYILSSSAEIKLVLVIQICLLKENKNQQKNAHRRNKFDSHNTNIHYSSQNWYYTIPVFWRLNVLCIRFKIQTFCIAMLLIQFWVTVGTLFTGWNDEMSQGPQSNQNIVEIWANFIPLTQIYTTVHIPCVVDVLQAPKLS
jgi:hypothetical protein